SAGPGCRKRSTKNKETKAIIATPISHFRYRLAMMALNYESSSAAPLEKFCYHGVVHCEPPISGGYDCPYADDASRLIRIKKRIRVPTGERSADKRINGP